MTAEKESITEVGGAIAPLFNSLVQTVDGELSQISSSLLSIQNQTQSLEGLDSEALSKTADELSSLNKGIGELTNAVTKWSPAAGGSQSSVSASSKGHAKASASQIDSNKLNIVGKSMRFLTRDTQKSLSTQRRLANALKKTGDRLNAVKGFGRIKKIGKAFGVTATSAQSLSGSIGFLSDMGSKLNSVNAITANQMNLAKSLGVSAKGLETWEGLATSAGLSAGSVGNMMKEMNGKLGKAIISGNSKPFGGALDDLGLSLKDLESMSPEQKFKKITSALKEMGDQDKAKSLAQQMFGGDASQFIGYLQNTKGSMEKLYAEQEKLSVLTKEGRQGSEKYVNAMTAVSTVLSSAKAEFCGLIGGALEPYVKTLAPKIGALFNEHRGDIKKFGQMLGEALPKIGEFAFGILKVMTKVGSVIMTVVDAVGGFGTVAAVVGGIMTAKFAISGYQMVKTIWGIGQAVAPLVSNALPLLGSMFTTVGSTLASIGSTVFPMLLTGLRTITAAFMANPIGLAIGLIGLAIGRVIAIWDDLKKAFMEGGVLKAIGTYLGFGGDDEEEEKSKKPKGVTKHAVGDSVSKEFVTQGDSDAVGYSISGEKVTRYNSKELIPKPMPMASSTETKQLNDNRNVTINVYASEGQSPKDVAQSVHSEFMNTSGEMFDYA